jgi:hypothetical protein
VANNHCPKVAENERALGKGWEKAAAQLIKEEEANEARVCEGFEELI